MFDLSEGIRSAWAHWCGYTWVVIKKPSPYEEGGLTQQTLLIIKY